MLLTPQRLARRFDCERIVLEQHVVLCVHEDLVEAYIKEIRSVTTLLIQG